MMNSLNFDLIYQKTLGGVINDRGIAPDTIFIKPPFIAGYS